MGQKTIKAGFNEVMKEAMNNIILFKKTIQTANELFSRTGRKL